MENGQNDQYKKELHELLSEVFLKDKTNETIKLIKKADKIPSILSFLYSNEKSLALKYECLKMLQSSFHLFPYNLEIFTRYTISEGKMNIFTILIYLYLTTNPEQFDQNAKKVALNYLKLIIDLLNQFVSNVTCSVDVYEYIYKFINKYISKSKEENEPELTKDTFLRFCVCLLLVFLRG